MNSKDKSKEKELNICVGHRKRVKEKFLKAQIRTLPDYELIEMLLFNCYPRRDTKPKAKALLNKFGSIKALISADLETIKDMSEASDSLLYQIKLLQDIFSRLFLATEEHVNILSNWNAVLNYCNLTMGFQNCEIFRVLYLNKKNVLIHDEILQTGTVDRVAIYPREIAKKSLSYSASAIILVHNHPSGETSPSPEDIEITHKIIKALEPLSIVVHDHLIISKDKTFSFKNSGLI
ncbi:DNA repair protein RadC [endosymbiont of Acanthamoeba sp. UWC8]|uniref:RadC family protein n=1 Tax=endosymbiont of Acanthamoeba sp. UWC8 TaxID=86106 RepID=UPI0004D1EC4D|nr:DNA repair protein RadC [endosymbiont of Acanthamoeba sp. UWC8]AIF80687.1 DNA repair protein RadC [endosymbiont of Acanthamoeba sp. UWC8]